MTKLYERAPGWDSDPAGECRPGTVAISDYVIETFGADFLGCYGDRAKTGGSSPSLHRDGRAVDLGFASVGAEKREEVFRWLVAHADELGIQMILNYSWNGLGGTRWRLPYYVGDPAAGLGSWRRAGHWLHVETTNAGADDGRSVAEKLDGVDLPTPIPTPDPDPAPSPTPIRRANVNVSKPILSRKNRAALRSSSAKAHVEECQFLLNSKGSKELVVDGDFGPKTERAVLDWQVFFGLEADGYVGPKTWGTLLSFPL